MGRRVIFDTTFLIDYERGRIDRSKLDSDDIAVAAISIAEYRTGIELADNEERATERARALTAIIKAVDVLVYSDETARFHAQLIAHTRRTGQRRGAHDLILAAHAVQTGRTLLSNDAAARFGSLPGVTTEFS